MEQKPVIVLFKLSSIDSTCLFCQKTSDIDSHVIDLSAGSGYVFPTELRSLLGSSFDISLKNCREMKTDKTGDATNTRTRGDTGRGTCLKSASTCLMPSHLCHLRQKLENCLAALEPIARSSCIEQSAAGMESEIHRILSATTFCSWRNHPYRPVETSPITQYDMKTGPFLLHVS